MWKLWLCSFVLFIFSPAWAWEYQLEESSLLRPSLFDMYEVSQHFKEQGLFALSDTSLTRVGLPFDNAYMGFQMKQNLVIKAGLVAPQQHEGQVIYEPSLDVFIFHFRLREIPYMVMGFNFSENEFKKVISPWLKIKRTSWLNLIIPSAYAETCEIPGASHQALTAASQSMSGEAILRKIGECGLESLKGAGDQAKNSFEFFKKLATNPKELWKETQVAFTQLKSFIQNINTELKSIFTNLGTMNLSDQLDIACHMSGHIFAAIAQSMITGPAALARNIPFVIAKLKKMSADIATAATLRKKGLKLPNNKKLVEEVTRCE